MRPHYHYYLGFVSFGGWFEPAAVSAIVELNFAANVLLMDDINYRKYVIGTSYSYYGGYATSSPVNIPIPENGCWHVVVDNGGDEMGGIQSSVHTKNYDFVV